VNRNTPTRSVPNPTLMQVAEWMRRFAHQGKADLEVRRLVEKICADIAPGDYASECLAIYYWACQPQNLRYMRDIQGVEFLKQPSRLLKTKAGDCDDIATLLAAMLMACGNKCEFVLVGFKRGGPPSHVYVQVITPKGKRVALDPVANRVTQQMLGAEKTRLVVPV
jgi:hypothetical protein